MVVAMRRHKYFELVSLHVVTALVRIAGCYPAIIRVVVDHGGLGCVFRALKLHIGSL